MNHIMVDIETFSLANNAALVSLGAVKFNHRRIVDRFHVGIDPTDCKRHGLDIDPDTVMWWMDPKQDEARKALMVLPKVDLHSALAGFKDWCIWKPNKVEVELDDLGSLWGNGATFDNVLIKSAYDAVGLEPPLSYKQQECYRTFKNRCPSIKFKMHGTKHDALADAESQAKHLIRICKKLGVAL